MLDQWQQRLQASGAAGGTIRTRVQAVHALQTHSGGADPVAVTVDDVASWLANCATSWTRRTYWYAVNAWFEWLVAEGVRADNPMTHIPRPRTPRGLPRPVSDAVIERMLTSPISGRCYEYTCLAVLAGLRVSEVARVHGTDVDRTTGTLYVCGKGDVEAFLPLHPRIAMLSWGKPDDDYWFPSRGREGHVQGVSVSQTLRRGLAAAGARGAKPHQLRHSYGTAVLRASHDLRVTQELMRHQSASSTAGYTKVSPADMVAAIESLPWAAGT